MKFSFIPPNKPAVIFGNAWTIYADGEIEPNSAAVLERLLIEKEIAPNSSMHLNSPGGSLAGGIALGRVIRKHGLLTYVSAQGHEEKIGDYKHVNSLPGICMSACCLSFLGGRFRWIGDESKYGVHRFYRRDKDIGSDAAQITSATIIEYIREMGADPLLFSEMTKAGPNEINILPRDKLVTLGVVSDGQDQTSWTVESTGNILYLKGERRTWRGMNKFIIHAEPGHPTLHIIFDPEGRGDEIPMLGAQSLMIDGDAIPISLSRLGEATLENGWVNASYALSADMLDKIRKAKTVGIAFQLVYGAPVFLGFDNMEVEPGRHMISGFLGLLPVAR